jgi:hypothetical protein
MPGISIKSYIVPKIPQLNGALKARGGYFDPITITVGQDVPIRAKGQAGSEGK